MFKFSSKKIALIAMFVALTVVVNVFEINITQELKISLSITICTLAGFFTGFIGGGIVGFLGDLLGCLITGLTPIPLLSLSNTLLGLLPGLAFDLYRVFAKKKLNSLMLIIITICCQLILFGLVTVLINNYAIWDFYKIGAKSSKSYWVWATLRVFPIQLINSSVNLVMSCILIVSLCKIPFFKEHLNIYKVKDEVKEQVEQNNDQTTNSED